MRRLQIDDSDAVEILDRLFVTFSISISSSLTIAMFSGRVTRPNERERRRLLVPSEDLTQRQAAGDGVRIRIVLKQNRDGFRALKMISYFLDNSGRPCKPDVPA